MKRNTAEKRTGGRIKQRLASSRGMTIAELLIVVAILIVLLAVSFIGIIKYQRSMKRLELDGIAKEIFVAAQNHLTASEGYLTGKDNGYGYGPDDEGCYYILVKRGAVAGKGTGAFDLMLPFGAVDETVRAGGCYVVRYQPDTGTMTDVFYCEPSGRFKNSLDFVLEWLLNEQYADLLALRGDGSKEARRDYEGSVIGWYGGEGVKALDNPIELKAPTIIVKNGDTLSVEIIDNNAGETELSGKYSLKLIINGLTSGAQRSVTVLRSTGSSETVYSGSRLSGYEFTLDDITEQGQHFSDLNTDTDIPGNGLFIPGENIRIQAIAYSNEELSNVAAGEAITNSLFADGTTLNKAQISSVRHLENLDKTVSGLDANDTGDKLDISSAVQTDNLDWSSFKNGAVSIYGVGRDDPLTEAGRYFPISPDYTLSYDGKGYSVSKIKAEADDAGLFGSTSDVSEIKDLELIDFMVTGTVSAGALAGTLGNTVVSNVLARSSTAPTAANVTAPIAGGLIGVQNGGSVELCAAALIVNGSTNAGGLIGKTAGAARVYGCYSGGHTENGKYSSSACNVTGGTAGGLIGSAGSADIAFSYSTCSVSGTTTAGATTAGGFVGSASGKITDCYCTGLVTTGDDNAFIGSGSLAAGSGGNRYLRIINEIVTKDGSGNITDVSYKGPGTDRATAIDKDSNAFNDFAVGLNSGKNIRDDAYPYDRTLINSYAGRYSFRTVSQLGAVGVGDTDFVNTHYGDWPSPEVFFINTKA